MGRRKKKFIGPNEGMTFSVVHRSQRDPEIANPDASPFVLVGTPHGQKKGKKGGAVSQTLPADVQYRGHGDKVLDEEDVPRVRDLEGNPIWHDADEHRGGKASEEDGDDNEELYGNEGEEEGGDASEGEGEDDEDGGQFDDAEDDEDQFADAEEEEDAPAPRKGKGKEPAVPPRKAPASKTAPSVPKRPAPYAAVTEEDAEINYEMTSQFGHDATPYNYAQHMRAFGDDGTFVSAKGGVMAMRDYMREEYHDVTVHTGRAAGPERDARGLPSSALPSREEHDVGLLNMAAPVFGPRVDLPADMLEEMDQAQEAADMGEDQVLWDDFFALAQEDLKEDDPEAIEYQNTPWAREYERRVDPEKAMQREMDEASEGNEYGLSDDGEGSEDPLHALRGHKTKTATTAVSRPRTGLHMVQDEKFEVMMMKGYTDEKVGELEEDDPDNMGEDELDDHMHLIEEFLEEEKHKRGFDFNEEEHHHDDNCECGQDHYGHGHGHGHASHDFDDAEEDEEEGGDEEDGSECDGEEEDGEEEGDDEEDEEERGRRHHPQRRHPPHQNGHAHGHGAATAASGDPNAKTKELAAAYQYESDGEPQEVIEMEKEPEWDVETILTTYTTSENHPGVIKAPPPKKRLAFTKRDHIPLDGLPTQPEKAGNAKEQAKSEEDGEEEEEDAPRVNRGVARTKKETPEEKRARKAAVKDDKKQQRERKKGTRTAFHEERLRLGRAMGRATPSLVKY